jgi:hypothetical protein
MNLKWNDTGIKALFHGVLDKTVGRILRTLRFLTLKGYVVAQKTVVDLIIEHAIEESSKFAIENFKNAMMFYDKTQLQKYCVGLSNQTLTIESNKNSHKPIIAEFGVWKGYSINFLATECPSYEVYGFDSFEGLEEDWYGATLVKGSFDQNSKMPKVKENVILIKGWFEDTVPSFVEKINLQRISIINMDADTYKPTNYVLNALSKNISKGTIIIFDEFFGYPNWRLHEYKAWEEFVKDFGISYRYIGFSKRLVAVEIL